jgi:hypothetical protein
MSFPLWYSGTEQILRYHAVKANAFARAPEIPDELLLGNDPYPAYLLENILPGQPEDPPKAFRRMIATEGVVASFFLTWATSDGLRESYRAPSFYEQFGIEIENVGPVENVYLKLFHVFYEHKPHDLLALIDAYEREYPDELAAVSGVARDTFLGQEMVAAPQLWLANPAFQTGTSLYDQFRGLPRTHTFDLNAASEVDLVGVRGVDRFLADMIRFKAPYASVEDLADVPGVTPEILEEFRELERAMERLQTSAQEMESELALSAILRTYTRRLIVFLVPAALIAGFFYWSARLMFDVRPDPDTAPARSSPSAREVGDVAIPLVSAAASGPTISRPSWIRILLNGVAATLVGLVGAASWGALPLGPSLVSVAAWLGLPGAAWSFWKTGDIWQAGAVLLAWIVAALPVAILMTPLP